MEPELEPELEPEQVLELVLEQVLVQEASALELKLRSLTPLGLAN